MAVNFKIEGMKELDDAIKRLGNIPRKHLRAATRKGAQKIVVATRAIAPKKTGALKRGITKKEERGRNPAKVVFDIRMDPNKDDIFIKKIGDTRYYYPASMEHGFKLRNGSKEPGRHYFKIAAENSKSAYEREVINELTKRIDKEWAKGR